MSQCWCCWESNATEDDPLIRACKGCKDKDLQLIHKLCLEKYLNGLPLDEFSDYRCTRCLDQYKVLIRWRTFKSLRDIPAFVMATALLSGLFITIIVFLLNVGNHFAIFKDTDALKTFGIFFLGTDLILTLSILLILVSTLPKSPYVRVIID